MITLDQWKQAVKSLRFASQLLSEGEKLTDIEIMASFRRGIKIIEEWKDMGDFKA